MGRIAHGIKEIQHRFKLEVRQYVTTNGHLLDQHTSSYLASLGITHAQVTVDGPKEVHDERRRLRRGGGTWSTIMENVDRGSDLLKVGLRINVDEHNYRSVPELLDYLTATGIRNRLKLVYVSPTQATSGPRSDWNRFLWDPATRAERMVWLWREMHARDYRVMVFPEPMPCGAMYLSSSVVDPSGKIHPCMGLMSDPSLSKGDLGGTPPSPGYVDLMNLEPWEHCGRCAFLPVCGGGCRWMASVTKRDHTAWMCELPFYRQAYPEFLKYRFSRQRLLEELSADDRFPVHIL
jgi:uncharacterized protein